jgi:hypothetical protein
MHFLSILAGQSAGIDAAGPAVHSRYPRQAGFNNLLSGDLFLAQIYA